VVDIIEGYETEEQQVDAIKSWWRDNGTTLIVSVVIGLAGLWGWRYYGESVLANQEEASSGFAQTLAAFEADKAQGTKEMQTFVAENQGNNYATLAALLLAKEAVDNSDFELAESQLSTLLSNNEYAELTPVIALRLARVQAELENYDQALATLATINETGFLAKTNEIKGSIYLRQGELDEARDAFQAAVDASEGRVDPILQLQLDDLAEAKENVAPAPELDVAQ